MANDSVITVTDDVGVLFEPIRIAGVTVPNRIVMAPMTRGFSADGVVALTAADYYRRRALGGTGLILTEGIATSDIAARTATVPQLTGGAPADTWRPVTRAVREAGSVIMAQLWHTGLGRQRHEAADPTKLSIGPVSVFLPDDSPHAPGGLYEPGVAMDQADIDATIDEYAAAAVNAQDAGFDGVELHAGHGYLIDQFFWAESNRRTDRYGAHRPAVTVRGGDRRRDTSPGGGELPDRNSVLAVEAARALQGEAAGQPGRARGDADAAGGRGDGLLRRLNQAVLGGRIRHSDHAGRVDKKVPASPRSWSARLVSPAHWTPPAARSRRWRRARISAPSSG